MFSFVKSLASQLQNRTARRGARTNARPRASKPLLEYLEERQLLSTFTVLNTNDDGSFSFRQAIVAANGNPNVGGPDRIEFNIPGAGVQTIAPLSQLPTITDPVVIDGYSQPGTSPNTLANGDNAVLLIELDGTMASATQGLGISSTGCQVQGLVINRFTFGIRISGAGNSVLGNFIGTDATGTMSRPNSGGVDLNNAANNTIGGTAVGARNLISGNGDGVFIEGANATGNVVQGNFIGTNATGDAVLGNSIYGVLINDAANNTIGGIVAGAGNVISGNAQSGVSIADTGGSGAPTGTVVQGNFIGTNVSGTAALGNLTGVDSNATNISIGGTVAGAGNTIAFNGNAGVIVIRPASGDVIRHNAIFANGGLPIDLAADFDIDGATPNDVGDADVGGDNRQNFPVLASADSNAASTTIAGALNSTPNQIFLLDFYASPAAASGLVGQTYVGVSLVTTDGFGNALFTVTLPKPVPAGWTLTATATTTVNAPLGDTSEFASAIEVTGTPSGPINQPPVLATIADPSVNEGSFLTFTATATDPDTGQTLTYSLAPGAPAWASINPVTGVFSATAPDGPASATITVRVTDNGSPQGTDSQPFTMTVNNVAPILTIGGNTTFAQGGTLNRSGAFTDPGADTWMATVNYGDGSGAQPLGLGADKTFTLDHVYANAGIFTTTVTVTDDDTASGLASFQVGVVAPAAVRSVRINDGSAQRSMINSITVTIDQVVTLDPDAFKLRKQGGKLVNVLFTSSVVGVHTEAVLLFSGAGISNGSLADGNYTLTLRADKVQDTMGRALDGDGDGVAGGNRSDDFFRFYGDADGDRDVDNNDYTLFKTTNGKRAGDVGYLGYFDFDGNAMINGRDRSQFLLRRGSHLNLNGLLVRDPAESGR